jgi:hypothetical protein
VTLPVFAAHEPSPSLFLGSALLLGLGFGFCLERAGFGSARRLVAVFYLYDMAVVKVMFTAIVTAMAGLTLLGATGLLDLSWVYVEPTHLAAQALGGLVFGTGFIVGGYCPGTAVAALATGRRDGLAFALGMLAGVASYAELGPGVEAWVAGGGSEQTLPDLTGVPRLWWTLLFVGVLAAAARLMAWLERRFATNRPTD